KIPERRIDVICRGSGILHRVPGNIVSHWDRSIDRWPSCPAIGKKVARLLILHLTLAFHIAKKLDCGHLPMLPLKTEQRDSDDRQQDGRNEKMLNHWRRSARHPCRRSPPEILVSRLPRTSDPSIRSPEKTHRLSPG